MRWALPEKGSPKKQSYVGRQTLQSGDSFDVYIGDRSLTESIENGIQRQALIQYLHSPTGSVAAIPAKEIRRRARRSGEAMMIIENKKSQSRRVQIWATTERGERACVPAPLAGGGIMVLVTAAAERVVLYTATKKEKGARERFPWKWGTSEKEGKRGSLSHISFSLIETFFQRVSAEAKNMFLTSTSYEEGSRLWRKKCILTRSESPRAKRDYERKRYIYLRAFPGNAFFSWRSSSETDRGNSFSAAL